MENDLLIVEMDDDDTEAVLVFQQCGESGGRQLASADGNRVKFDTLVKKALPQVTKLAKEIKAQLVNPNGADADEVEMEFSMGFTGNAQVMIASAEMTSGITVRMKWEKKK